MDSRTSEDSVVSSTLALIELYQSVIIAMSRAGSRSARLTVSATWQSSQPPASSSLSMSAVMGSPNFRPDSANDVPGQGHTARQPSW